MKKISPTIKLCQKLIQQQSITPDDSKCLPIIADRLKKIGFKNEFLKFDKVNNLYSRFGDKSPLLLFAGHTDVVPTGDQNLWDEPPFSGNIIKDDNGDDILYGRGSADMKGGIAAFVVAVEEFLKNNTNFKGSIGFLLTADEEAEAVDGTIKVIEVLQKRAEIIDYCLLGEPSCKKIIGDEIKIGRRGSLSLKLTIIGKQGHVAYPHLAQNPIHNATAFLDEICHHKWDDGNESFPPSTFQISNIKSGTGATNVIPADMIIEANFRFSTAQTPASLQEKTIKMLQKYGLKYDLKWTLSGNSFLSVPGKLVEATTNAIYKITGLRTKLSTTGGTSDGRFIAPTGAETIELGLLNETIHQINERVKTADLNILNDIYCNLLTEILTIK
ncbi:MAG: succinyl-diaminopimelate desuccinylase [Gammaproteobacteria bacterium]|nr:MAG: succinyl-diaminopimelate desuccinylase [Gammaproteobacteria bacterium]